MVHHTNGVQNYRAVFCLIGLTGNIDIHGGNMMNPPSVVHIVSGFPSREAPSPRLGAREPARAHRRRALPRMEPPRHASAGVRHPAANRDATALSFEGRVLHGPQLPHVPPTPRVFLESLCELDFIVDVDLFLTDSAKYADIVLPACSSVERSELRCWPAGYVMLSQPAIEPVGEARSDFDIICELSKRLGLGDELLESGFEACVDWIRAERAYRRDAEEASRRHVGAQPRFAPERKYLKRGFNTPSGKLEFVSEVLAQNRRRRIRGAASYREPTLSPASAPDVAAEFPLVLSIGARKPMFQHSRMFRVSWIRQFAPDPVCDVNPADAARAGIVEGDAVDISTPRGTVRVLAHLTATVREGDVHLYHDWPEANGNDLMAGDYLDPVSDSRIPIDAV